MKTKILISLCLIALLFSCSKDSIIPDPVDPPSTTPVFNPATDNFIVSHEMRAAWLTTAWKLDWPGSATGAAEQKALLISLIDRLKSLNINVIFFQAMTSCEAFYNSSILPWSAYLTGTMGTDPGYDPLKLAIDAAHERGMELHAWINPLRVGSESVTYVSGHPALLHPERYCTYNKVRYWNAGLPEVREYLRDVVAEIINNYDVDGIHFDDYFYPDGLQRDAKEWDDSQAYAQYGGGKSLAEWREANIDNMVKGVHDKIADVKPKVIFGISPSGQYANTLALYANPVTWLNQKSIDYLAPQIYWQIGHSTADFDKLARFWSSKSGGIPIFPGIAAYRLGESGFPSPSEFLSEVLLCRSLSNVLGNCWFRTEHILAANLNSYIKSNIYPGVSLVPKMGNYNLALPERPVIAANGRTITWNKTANSQKYALYELEKGSGNKWSAKGVYIGENNSFTASKAGNYVIVAVNGREKSSPSDVIFVQ